MSIYENYYETYVIKNPTSETICRELAGGEAISWSMGDKLRILSFYREALEKIAEGRATFPADYAARFLDRMDAYEGKRNTKTQVIKRSTNND